MRAGWTAAGVRALRTLVPAGMAAVLALAGVPARAWEVVRSQRALADVPTRLVPASEAPATVLRPPQPAGGLAARTQESTLQRSAGPQTVLREAEVPRERLAQTRALWAELKARPTPEQAISIDLPADVLFDFDKADLRPDAAPSLDKAAELIKSYAAAPLTVRGHTDGKGTDAYNDSLSLRRAETVSAALRQRTGRPARVEGLGKREPVAPNTTPDGRDDPQGRQLNRRVQILIGVPGTQPKEGR
ncbi:MAG: OmpA family protein [Acidovorax sp.]|uniref:OmpA family protein n=1 Tax=Acidovorax sp. TaxID=1872122 RepID=UPI0025C32B8F|nr:OmpA family protein [Acidovorax sp.]MCE1192454.1 OmpA family protein [Acidovorax sp.]